jgi:hypothetical protein
MIQVAITTDEAATRFVDCQYLVWDPTDTAQYNFESGTQGWTHDGGSGVITNLVASTANMYAGAQSLEVYLSGAGIETANVATPGTPAGAIVTFHVWPPTGVTAIQPYVIQDGSGGWTWTGSYRGPGQFTPNAWNTITVQVPVNAAPLYQLGVEFTYDGSATRTGYIDSVSW